MDLNLVVFSGRLTKDPQVVNSKDDKTRSRGQFSLAVNGYNDRVLFVDCVVFDGHLIDVLAKYTKKGSSITIRGQLTSYQDQNKINRYRVIADQIILGPKTQTTTTEEPTEVSVLLEE